MRLRFATAAALLLAATLPAVALTRAEPAEAARTYGSTPLDDVLYWAGQEARCGLTRDRLAAIMLSPTWAETGAPSTQAPSPMTMSRWDNQAGLHSFGNPGSFPRAFWHPGIGPWQFDSAGLGAPMTARDRIDSFISAAKAADTMAARWCANPSLAYVWAPWHACSSGACTTAYSQMYVGGALTGMVRNTAVDRMGGMEERTCEGVGASGPFTCWRVDPAVAQGYLGWTAPGFGPAPLTAPFYVYAVGGLEYRHWLPADTGYGNGIWATRPLGSNARTSLTWRSGVTLVDHGAFVPCPDLGVTLTCENQTVTGTYRSASGDFDGDGYDDVLWHAPGAAADWIWWGGDGGAFTHTQTAVSGNYTPVSGDFNRDGRDDIFWYAPGSTRDAIWWGRADRAFTGVYSAVSGFYVPLGGDFDGDGFGDILWYAAGPARDAVWWGRAGGFTGTHVSVSGTYRLVAGDFDDNGATDVMWHAPGGAADYVWWGTASRTFASSRWSVAGPYTLAAADIDGDGPDDIIWYGLGTQADYVWFGRANRSFVPGPAAIFGSYLPLTGDFDQAFADDVLWYAPGTTSDWLTISS